MKKQKVHTCGWIDGWLVSIKMPYSINKYNISTTTITLLLLLFFSSSSFFFFF
jgi:hypothetical protein